MAKLYAGLNVICKSALNRRLFVWSLFIFVFRRPYGIRAEYQVQTDQRQTGVTNPLQLRDVFHPQYSNAGMCACCHLPIISEFTACLQPYYTIETLLSILGSGPLGFPDVCHLYTYGKLFSLALLTNLSSHLYHITLLICTARARMFGQQVW